MISKERMWEKMTPLTIPIRMMWKMTKMTVGKTLTEKTVTERKIVTGHSNSSKLVTFAGHFSPLRLHVVH